MAFLIYKKTTGGKNVHYEKIKPLKFSGRDGLIARHVQTLSDAETQSWKLDAAALLKLAGITPARDTLAILFDITARDAKSVCLYELVRIHGSCRATSTQLALDFSVVIDREIDGNAAVYAGKFIITPPAQPKLLGEMLALTGGPGGGDWKWDATSLQLGATVVHAQPGPPTTRQ
ncbi:MAG: hypothetical protein ACLP2Y_05855 [Limisphaerales bacterium]